MSSISTSDHPVRHATTLPLVVAWVSVALVPVSVIVGRVASTAFLEAQGYPPSSTTEPPGLGLASFGIFALPVLVPTVSAVWFGLAAAHAGRRSGLAAASLAGVIGGGLVLLGLPLYLSRLIGWPVVLGIGVVLAAVVGALAARSRRRARGMPEARGRGPAATPPAQDGGGAAARAW